MTPRLPSCLLLAAAPLIVSAAPEPPRTQWAQVTIRERVIIRIPRMSPIPRGPAAAAVTWEERKASRCVPLAALNGAVLGGEGAVDLMTGDGRRFRAVLDDDCPTLDFYSGFYLKPTGDGQVCARRDAIRSRSGARCLITGFRQLVARH